jgi:hypothetical protein
MLVTGVEEIPEIKEVSILKLLLITMLSICTLAGMVGLIFTGVQKVLDVYSARKKRVDVRHPYYYSVISG